MAPERSQALPQFERSTSYGCLNPAPAAGITLDVGMIPRIRAARPFEPDRPAPSYP